MRFGLRLRLWERPNPDPAGVLPPPPPPPASLVNRVIAGRSVQVPAGGELDRLAQLPIRWVTRSEAIDAIREAARPLGYAVAVHGSLRRDVDLVAVPWVDAAAAAEDLITAVCTALPGGGHVNGPPADKPHLRRAWSIIALAADPWDQDGWYIDLSVLPTFGALVTAANQDAFSVERCEGCSAVVASDTCWRDSEGVALCPDCGASHQEHAGGSW